MKAIFAVLNIVLLVNMSYATPVRLADRETLRKRLCKESLDHFIEKTNILDQLAGKEKEPCGVVLAVELSLYDYGEYLKQPMMAHLMQLRKPQIIDLLLEEHKEAREEAKNMLNAIKEDLEKQKIEAKSKNE